MAKMGRPQSVEKKNRTIGIRLSEDEYKSLKKYAFEIKEGNFYFCP